MNKLLKTLLIVENVLNSIVCKFKVRQFYMAIIFQFIIIALIIMACSVVRRTEIDNVLDSSSTIHSTFMNEVEKPKSKKTEKTRQLLKYMFSDFSVDSIFKDKPADIDFSSDPDSFRFRTVISETYKAEGVNFAGHYCFIWWSCGSPCQSGVIVDASTGKIYSAPSASLGYKFYKDSRLIITNPPETPDGYDSECSYCEPFLFLWDEDEKVFIEIKRR